MKNLTPILIISLLSICGLQNLNAQEDFSSFEGLFNTAVANIGGGDGDTSTDTDQNQQPDRDGGGNLDVINADWPHKGKMVIKKTTFTWSAGIQPTSISIKQGFNEVFKSPVSGNSITINLEDLNLEEGKMYNIQLLDGTKLSRRTSIEFVQKSVLQEEMKTLKNDIAFKKADGVKKKLMKAFFLDTNGYNYEAYNAYHISTSNPSDMKVIVEFFDRFNNKI